MRDLLPCPPCGRQGRPGQGFLAGSNIRAAGERPPRARPQRRGSPGPIPNPAVKPAFAESTAALGCGRAGRRARGGRFSIGAERGPRGMLPLRAFSRLGEVAASLAARSALRCIRPPPGIVGRAGTARGSSLAGLSASWDIVRWGGLIGAARRRLFIFMRPRRGSRAWAEGPQGDRPLWVFLYSEAVRCRRICARTSCWTGPVHGMCWRICVGSLRAF